MFTPAASPFHLTRCVYLRTYVANITGCFSVASSVSLGTADMSGFVGQILGARIALQSCSSFNTFWFIFLKSHTLEQKMSLSRLPGESSPLLRVTLRSGSD